MELLILMAIGILASAIVAAAGVAVDKGIDQIQTYPGINRFFQWLFLYPLYTKIEHNFQESFRRSEVWWMRLLELITRLKKLAVNFVWLVIAAGIIYLIAKLFLFD
jgi:hypothetical protein